MNYTPDDNDMVYNTYGLDLVSLFHWLYEKVLGGDWQAFLDKLETWWTIYSIIALLLSFIFFVGYIYAKIRESEILDEGQADLRAAEAAWKNRHERPDSKNTRWDAIQQRVSENNPESWRIAIIEADIMLEETLNNAGYIGQSLGEKLKSANVQSFITLQDAWEAHKVRNEIAHVGSDFILTKKVAQETLTHFERVFREFGVL